MRVLVARRFERRFRTLPRDVQTRLLPALEEIRARPFSGKRLSGEWADDYSWRVGPYRIIYMVTGEDIWLETVGHRREVYRS